LSIASTSLTDTLTKTTTTAADTTTTTTTNPAAAAAAATTADSQDSAATVIPVTMLPASGTFSNFSKLVYT